MNIKRLSLFSLFFTASIVNGMDSQVDSDFNMEDLIRCALNSRVDLGKGRDCFNAGYLTEQSRFQNMQPVSSGDLTDKSKERLSNYFFEPNKYFNPSERCSDPYLRKNGTGNMRDEVEYIMGACHETLQKKQNTITYNLSETFNEIAKEYNGLKLHKDFDQILMKKDDFDLQEKATIIEYRHKFEGSSSSLWYYYITKRIRGLHKKWDGGKNKCTLSNSEITEKYKAIDRVTKVNKTE